MSALGLEAQEWHKIYFLNRSNWFGGVFEGYDKGYVIGGGFVSGVIPKKGMIIKTDINGEMLWYKTVSNVNDVTDIRDINQTYDDGIILTGITGEQTNQHNPFIMKLNKCAEPEWCRIYNTPNPNDEWGQAIWPIPGGYIALIYSYGDDPIHERVWLYRLDNNGDLLWKNLYGQTSTDIKFEQGEDLYLTSDFHFIISGFCYYPDPGSSTPYYLRPFVIKTDSTGTAEWELPWSLINSENFYGESYSSVSDNHGTIYTAGRHIVIGGTNAGDKPCMMKTDSSGNELSYHDIFPLSKMGACSTINWFADSTLALGYGWTDTLTSTLDGMVGVVKCNQNGDILIDKPLFVNQYMFGDGVSTFDNKLLLVGGFKNSTWTTQAYKFNSNLEFDSIYTRPFTYDSLCPHPIPSDTIPLNCVLVGTEEQQAEDERTEILIFPNPAEDVLHIVLPNQIKTTQKTTAFSITTWRARWEATTLAVFDLFGRQRFTRELKYGEKEVTLSVSGWQPGLYLIRLSYHDQTVASGKVVVR